MSILSNFHGVPMIFQSHAVETKKVVSTPWDLKLHVLGMMRTFCKMYIVQSLTIISQFVQSEPLSKYEVHLTLSEVPAQFGLDAYEWRPGKCKNVIFIH